jgi:PAS domain S-box-containing protein
MGRYLEYGPLRRIDDLTGFNVAFDWQGTEVSGTGLPAGLNSLPGEENLILRVNNETSVTGYSTIQDLAGKDVGVRVTKDRQLYRIGLTNITTSLVILAFWAIITGLIVVVVMDRMVLQRMGVLTKHVRSLSGNQEEVPAPVLSGNDELAELEKTIIDSRWNLLLSEQQLRVFVNAMPGPAALFSREGRILLANPAFAGYLDKPVEAIVGADIRSYLPSRDIEKSDWFVQEAIRKKEAVHFEIEIEGKTLFMSLYPVLGSDGEVIQLGLLVVDISERKQIEEALRDSQTKLAEAMDLAHLVNWEFDVPTGIFTFNDRFYAMYGTTAEREGGYRMPAEVYAREFVHPDDANLVANEVNKAIAATDPDYTRQVEHRIIRRGGEIRYIIVRTAITKDAEGRTVRTHGANQDITEHKQAEELRRHFTEELEQQVRSRTQELETSLNEKVVLLREVHHRVKNNFQIIISLLSLQSRDIGDEKVTRAMRESQNRIRAMAFVHETMYSSADFARIDLESYVKYLTTQLFTFFEVRPGTISLILDIKNIFIDINTAIPLGLVINELVSNSLKHAFPEGRKGCITISIVDDQKGLTLTFRDNGIGFPAGFDWKTTKTFGFSLIRILIDQLDGTLEQEPSEGTLFIIRVMKKTDDQGRLHGTFNPVPE